MELNKIVKRKSKIVRAGTDFFRGSLTLMCIIIAIIITNDKRIEYVDLRELKKRVTIGQKRIRKVCGS